MKKISSLLFLLFIAINFTFGQSASDSIRIDASSGDLHFYQNENRLKIRQVVSVMKSNEEAHQMMRSARRNFNSGLALGIVGGGLLGYGLSDMLFNEESENGGIITLAGLGLVITSFILDSGFKRKARNAVDVYNRGRHTSSLRKRSELRLSTTSNGVGLTWKF